MTSEDFVEWVLIEMDHRGWNRRELSIRMDISATQVTRVLNREQLPGIDFLNGVARAFGLPTDVVFRRAGILPEDLKDPDDIIREVLYELGLAPKNDREEILEFSKMKRMIRERNEKYDSYKGGSV